MHCAICPRRRMEVTLGRQLQVSKTAHIGAPRSWNVRQAYIMLFDTPHGRRNGSRTAPGISISHPLGKDAKRQAGKNNRLALIPSELVNEFTIPPTSIRHFV